MDKEKLNDIICQSSSDYRILNDAYDYIDSFEQQCKKQKEIIDKAIEYINNYESITAFYEYIDEDGNDEYNYDKDFKKELLDILKEV